METKHIYEIYTKNPKTGESGWDIKFVLATKSTIKLYPNFDCIITVDDYPLQNPRPKLINFIQSAPPSRYIGGLLVQINPQQEK